MSVILVLIGFSLLLAASFLFAFIWAVKTGQYDDSYTPSVRILFENKTINNKTTYNKNINKNEKV